MNSETYYLHYDQVGTLRAISNQKHQIVKEISYDTYGNILNDTNPNFKIPFGFAGGLHDRDTNLVHFGYREYDPKTGKWTAKDPIDFSGGDFNLYGYVLNDPVGFVDPEGLFSFGLSAYYGWGGAVSFGRNPDGKSFLNLRIGLGIGGGAFFDPKGKSSNYRDDGCYGSAAGIYGKVGVTLGPLSLNYGGSAGASTGAPNLQNSLYSHQGFGATFGRGFGLGASLSTGGGFTSSW